MNSSMRPVTIGSGVGFVAMCLIGLHFFLPSISFAEANRGVELARRGDAIASRAEARQQIACELIAQQRTLADAIEQFRELDQEWPNHPPTVSEARARTTAEEWAYGHIRALVEDMLRDRPEEAEAVLHRLEQEFARLTAASRDAG